MSAVRRDGGVTGLGVLPGLWRVTLDQALNGNCGRVEVPKSSVPECSESEGRREHPKMAGTASSQPNRQRTVKLVGAERPAFKAARLPYGPIPVITELRSGTDAVSIVGGFLVDDE